MCISYFKQSLTTLDLSNNHIGDLGAQYLGEALKKNTVNIITCFCLWLIQCFLYRYLPRSISIIIRSETKAHSILVKDYNRIQWIEFDTLVIISNVLTFLFIQTLITFYFYNNQIGDKGAQHLGQALQKNSVRIIVYPFLF